MSGIGNIANNFDFRTLSQPIAAEKEGGWKKFGRILGGVASAAAAPITGGVLQGAGIDSNFNRQLELIQLQEQIQQQTQIINTVSNVSKSKHEAAMAAIRNMK